MEQTKTLALDKNLGIFFKISEKNEVKKDPEFSDKLKSILKLNK